MIPYFIVFFICFLFTILDLFIINKSLKNIMIILYGIIIIFFAGLRWETGTDWENYLSAFNNVQNVNLGESGFEFLYELLLRFSSSLSNSYTLLLFLIAMTIFSLTLFPLKKYSPYPLFSLLLLLSYSINSSGFGYRQDLAISICFFSFFFVLRRKLFFFLFFVLLATFFHQSAIIFLPVYWVSKFVWNKKTIIYLTMFIIVFYFIISKIGYIAALYSESAAYKVSNYNEMSPDEKIMGQGDPLTVLLRGIFNRIVLLIPALIVFFKSKLYDQKFSYIFNIMFFGLVFYVLLSPLGYVFLRFTRYYEMFQILLIPLAIYFSKPKTKILLILFYLFYCVFKFVFVLISDDEVYVPYQTIFNI